MIFHFGLLLMFSSSVRTTEYAYDYGFDNAFTELKQSYSLWPSMHNAMARIYKREASSDVSGLNEGGGTVTVVKNPTAIVNPGDSKQSGVSAPITAPLVTQPGQPGQPGQPQPHLDDTNNLPKVETPTPIETEGNHTAAGNANNSTETKASLLPKHLNLNDSRVIMRGIIVFGGFMLLAVAYYVFYRKNGNKKEAGSVHNTNDTNQFRYGVLKSDDKRDNMELSVPLTFESDDDDDDEDLEIFNLEQKKKSLSYVNLQTNDEDLVFPTKNDKETDKENLLLDIDDTGSETLINWSSNSNNKSIL